MLDIQCFPMVVVASILLALDIISTLSPVIFFNANLLPWCALTLKITFMQEANCCRWVLTSLCILIFKSALSQIFSTLSHRYDIHSNYNLSFITLVRDKLDNSISNLFSIRNVNWAVWEELMNSFLKGISWIKNESLFQGHLHT